MDIMLPAALFRAALGSLYKNGKKNKWTLVRESRQNSSILKMQLFDNS